jgi:hypothetical protein
MVLLGFCVWGHVRAVLLVDRVWGRENALPRNMSPFQELTSVCEDASFALWG